MNDVEGKSAAAYRRGSVLGFTIGEIFILLSFILLLILLLKQAEVFQQQQQVSFLKNEINNIQNALVQNQKKLDETLAANHRLASSVDTWTSFSTKERQQIIKLIETGELFSATSIASALKEMSSEELGGLIDQAKKPGRDDLLASVQTLSGEAVQLLAELFAASEDIEGLASSFGELGGLDPYTLTRGVTIARSVQELDPRISNENVADALDAGMTITENLSPDDWQRLKQLMETASWSPEKLERAFELFSTVDSDAEASLAERVDAALEEASQRSFDLASSLDGALGDVVQSRGGSIDAMGTISFPDATLFTRGKADLTDDMRAFLDELCYPWLSTLKNQGFEIKEIRIEGHASPGWRGASDPQEAYLRNLELSQSRARVVLEYCIDETWGQDLGEWARARSVAIGYSSSRPVIVNGEVSLDGSQRVLLSAAPDTSDIMRDIEASVSQP